MKARAGAFDTLSENARRYEREKANFYAKYQQYIDNYDPITTPISTICLKISG